MMKFFKKIVSWFKRKFVDYKFGKKVKKVKSTFSKEESKISNQLIDNAAIDLKNLTHVNNTEQAELLFKITVDTIRKILPLRYFVGFKTMDAPVGKVKTITVTKADADNRMTVEVISNLVSAKGRLINSYLNMSDIQNLEKSFIKDEIIDALSSEIAREISVEIFNIVEKASHKVELPDLDSAVSNKDFINNIYKEANDIARRCRRGVANVMLVSPMVATAIIANASDFKMASDRLSNASFMTHLGTLGRIEIFVNPLMEDKIILGYLNDADRMSDLDIIDGGMFFVPYKVVVAAGTSIDPRNFENLFRFMTRFGSQEDMAEIEKYYTTITVKIV